MHRIILQISNLIKSFNGIRAVDNISFSIEKATVTSIIGPNGAGKTTLFNLINGFINQDSGCVYYKGRKIDKLSPENRAKIGIGRLWQDIRLFRNMTVLENLLVAKKNNPGEIVRRNFFLPKSIAKFEKHNIELAEEILGFINLKIQQNTLAQNLSYGQQKLLAIGRLLMNDAELLLLDEPFAGVNPIMIDEISELIKKIVEQGKTILMIEHNVPKALSISDFVFVMDEGKIALYGLPRVIYDNSQLKDIYIGV